MSHFFVLYFTYEDNMSLGAGEQETLTEISSCCVGEWHEVDLVQILLPAARLVSLGGS